RMAPERGPWGSSDATTGPPGLTPAPARCRPYVPPGSVALPASPGCHPGLPRCRPYGPGDTRRRPRISVGLGSHDLPDHLPLHERQPLVPPEVRIRQLVLVQPELVEDRRVQVAEVIRLLDGAEADGVGGADGLPPLDAAAGHPHREADVVVVAAPAGF